MKVRVCGSLIVGLLMCAVSVFAQQGTSEIRGRLADAQGGALPGVSITVRNQDTGMFRETVSNPDGTYFVSGIVPGVYEITAELQAFRKYQRKDVRLEVGKTTTIDIALAVGALEEVVSVTAESPIVDITSKEVGGTVTGSRTRRAAIGQPQLRRLRRPAARHHSVDQHRIVRQRFDHRQRAGPAQQQLHARRRQQQRRCDRAAGGHAGADADRSCRGVPGDHEPVRRRVRPDHRRDHQCGHQAGYRTCSAAAPSCSDRTPPDRQGLFREEEQHAPSPTPSQWQLGGTLGGPIVKDKANFFGSLERVIIDRGITIIIPARPDLNCEPDHPEPRLEHHGALRSAVQRQPHLGRPVAARDLAAAQPDHQPVGDNRGHAGGLARGERHRSDGRRTSLNSVLGNTKVNTLRVGWTQEDVSFAQSRASTATGATRVHATPTLRFQTYTDQQNGIAQARVNDALPDRGHLHLVPAKQARRPRPQVRGAVPVRRRRTTSRRTT